MILSDQDIKLALERGQLSLSPSPKPEDIQPASLDVHLGTEFLILQKPYSNWSELDTQKDCSGFFTFKTHNVAFVVPPHGLVLAKVAEYLALPLDIACQVGGKSSLGRLGLGVHVTAGWVDPGWAGHLTLELDNATDWPIRIHVGQKIAQLIFYQTSSPSQGYKGKYQNADRVQVSRSHLDRL